MGVNGEGMSRDQRDVCLGAAIGWEKKKGQSVSLTSYSSSLKNGSLDNNDIDDEGTSPVGNTEFGI